MNLRMSFTLAIVKTASFFLRFFGRGGTSLPGKIALGLYPQILQRLSQGIITIIVTGTNGKTTTSRIIARILETHGLRYFENRSGANLLGGVVASFAQHARLTGKMPYDHAVIECDEAAFKAVSRHVDVDIVLVTNLFRDQLDRFGEITHALENIRIGIENSNNAVVCLNADCSLSSSLKDTIDNKVVFFGISTGIDTQQDQLSDAPYCIRCKNPYQYHFVTYQHLGGFYCDNCGYQRQDPDVYVSGISGINPRDSVFELVMGKESYHARVNLPGAYNIYNAVAAASVAFTLGIPGNTVTGSLSSFECGFGRMERMDLDGTEATMILVKNPAGMNQAIRFVSGVDTMKNLVLILNDRHADGTDISWIWDVHFEDLAASQRSINTIFVSGIRAEDMAVRLKYAGLDMGKVTILKEYGHLVEALTTGPDRQTPVYILPTYTGMFDFRRILARRFRLREFWR
ncbi:MAG: MurT ligase domain-containing protein [Clostridia bacterium]